MSPYQSMNHDIYSSGPFTPVHFLYSRDGLHVYRYRCGGVHAKGSLIHTIFSIYDGGPRLSDILERMSH